MKTTTLFLCSIFALAAKAHVPATGSTEVLADANLLKTIGAPILAKNDATGVAYSFLTPAQQDRLTALNHALGHCAGFEALPPSNSSSIQDRIDQLQALEHHDLKNMNYESVKFRSFALAADPKIDAALAQLSEDQQKQWVTWLSSFPNRYNRDRQPNKHIDPLVQKIQTLFPMFGGFAKVETIDHRSTQQKSIRVTLTGKSKPEEIVILGGHLDSINQGFGGGNAPGADDNASGSANLLDTLRVMIAQGQPERTVEFYWYAGEESGLLGSAEIAADYKAKKKNVVAVLQLDMTLYPGNGEFVIGNVTDFTSAWLRDFLIAANDTYLHVKLAEDKCGYACSDHASWYKNGYPTLLPFEATTNTMNRNIHTANDVISNTSSFRHAFVFSKIALIFAMNFGNGAQTQPY